MQLDVFLLILRLLLIVLLYLFLMQVVIVITRDLRKGSVSSGEGSSSPPIVGHLIVVDPGPTSIPRGTRFNLEPRTMIGRAPTCTIQITDNTVSTEHTRLWYQNNTWYVQDAGSKNGTYLNKQPAREALPVRMGDIIHVGYIAFKLTQ